jgi:hypothetical protein
VSTLSQDFIRSIVRAVERAHGTMAEVDRLVTAWGERANGNGAGLHGVLRTFEGDRLPRATEDVILVLRVIFADKDTIAAGDLASALGMATKRLDKLLEPAGIAPLSVKVDGGTRKGYRRGPFAGYFEQLDAAYAAPVRDADEELVQRLKEAFDAVEIPAEAGDEAPKTAEQLTLLRWWAERPGRQPDRGAGFIRETNERGARAARTR